MKKFSIKESIKLGWEITKKNIGFLVGVVLIAFFVNLIPNFVTEALGENENNASLEILKIVIALAAWILNLLVSLGMVKVSLAILDKKEKNFSDLFNGYPLLLNFFVGSILYALVVFLGLILFIIPGIYFAIKYQFYSYFIVDKKMGAIEAMKASGKITQGVKLHLIIFSFALGILNLLGMLALGIGLLVTIPVTMLAYAHVYRELSKPASSSLEKA